MAELTMREMLEAGVHFGHQTNRWNPKLNAIVAKLDDDACLQLADAADAR